MIKHKKALVVTGLLACLSIGSGCQSPASTRSNDYMIIDVVDEFGLDQPSESWQFTTPGVWRIQADGQRRFLYVVPLPTGRPAQPAAPGEQRQDKSALGESKIGGGGIGRGEPGGSPAPSLESATYGKYHFRNFSFSCWVRLDRFAASSPCNASIVFGRQDDQNCLRLDLSDFFGKPDIAVVRVENGRVARLASANPAPGSDFTRQAWHQVGILRDLAKSTIEVYVDEGGRPLLRATTAANEWGSIALASTTGGAAFGRVMISGEAKPMR